MTNNTYYCPGGKDSQSGSAVSQRYGTDVGISECAFNELRGKVEERNSGPFIMPIWNSHEGEVLFATDVWKLLEEGKVKITDIWAKPIEFWLVRRTAQLNEPIKTVGSVKVAKTQCSGFLADNNAEFEDCGITTETFKKYKNGKDLSAVLLAPGQGEEDGYEVVQKNTANPNNFTSFVKLNGVQHHAIFNADYYLTGVTMPSFGAAIGDPELSFFSNLFEATTDLRDVPRLIFVFKRTAQVGLLFEGSRMSAGDFLDADEVNEGEVTVNEETGFLKNLYTEELGALFAEKFPALKDGDFLLHRGVSTCLFACPPLELYTHGYDAESVEPVIRFYIHKFFDQWNNGADCSEDQAAFFERYKDDWLERGANFITFKLINAT